MDKELKLSVKTADWFCDYVEELKTAALNSVKKGVPEDVAYDNFKASVRSAAYEALQFDL